MKKIIINENPWQTRVAIEQDGRLQNVYFSAHAIERLERSYFKGVVAKVLPGIQTAFVDIGKEKAGFLHISEVDRELAVDKISTTLQDDEEQTQKKPRRRERPDIKNIFREGDPVLVQVGKEPIYEKGAKLTTCFTLPGRFIVLMPNIPRIGVSKKIANREERYALKDLVRANLPEGMGAIIRTTAQGIDHKNIIKDIGYLVSTWEGIQTRFANAEPSEKIHEDLEISLQVVRDHLNDNVEVIVTDDKDMQSKLYKFIKSIAPEHSHKVQLYSGKQGIFEKFAVDKQVDQALKKRADLKSGGSLIIESTEAMTVVDVNTGRFTGKSNLEETIFKTNLEAAEETVRQLRLRNIGGLIVIDFIDMASASNRTKLFNFFEKMLRERDKFQSVVLKVSEFGLVQMTRKRSGKTLVQELTNDCSCCKGSGFVKSLQTECYELLRALKKDVTEAKIQKGVTIHVSPAMFDYITNVEYNAILKLEKICACKIQLSSKKDFAMGQYKIVKK